MSERTPLALPDFPWDALVPFARRAAEHPEGLVDLSVGSPVDPTPEIVRTALAGAADAHAYPLTSGSVELREAIASWFARRRGVDGLTAANVLPSIGSKELIALLPLMLGIRAGDTVVHPVVAYPTYAIGAAMVGAEVVASDNPAEWPEGTKLIWVNSPGNPTGRVFGIDWLRSAVARARELGAVIASDECYAELNWESAGATPSILDPRVIGERLAGEAEAGEAETGEAEAGGSTRESDLAGVLAVYSLSKQSNMAGYRAGIVAGSSDLISELLAVRKHAGLLPPLPVQVAMIAALSDDSHVSAQREIYRARRARLVPALEGAGFRIDHSEAGLYLWATRGEDAWATVAQLAERGILVVPGSFYSTEAPQHVRVALTVTDERLDSAIARLGQ